MHIVAYTDGEVRQEFEVSFIGRPVGGAPAESEEASAVGWFHPVELETLDIHATMRRQIRHFLDGDMPHLD